MRISDIGDNFQKRGWLRYRQTAIIHVSNQQESSTQHLLNTYYKKALLRSLSFNRGHKKETIIQAQNMLSATR